MNQLPLDAIRQLGSSNLPDHEVYELVLPVIVASLSADAGIIWEARDSRFQPLAQHSAAEQPAKVQLDQTQHDRLLREACESAKPVIYSSSHDKESTDAERQISQALLLGRFERAGVRLVEVVLGSLTQEQLKNASATLQRALEFLSPASDGSERQRIQSLISESGLGSYLATIHSSIDRNTACSNVANETRREFGFDRVSVALLHHGKYRIMAISGQPSVNRRSSTTKLLESLTRNVLRAEQQFWYPTEADLPTQIDGVLEEYLQVSSARSIVVVPIEESVSTVVQDPEALGHESSRIIGGMVFEQFTHRLDPSNAEPAIEFAKIHAGNAIRNACRHHSLFLFPVWNLLGKSRVLVAPRMLPKTVLVSIGILLAALILCFWQVDFYVSADGVLVPKTLRPVFAKVDGDVAELNVDHGSDISRDQALLRLTSREHEMRVKDLESKIELSAKRLETIQDQMFTLDENPDAQAVQDNIEALKAQIANYREQQVILSEVTQNMSVRSPIDGKVITWDLKRRLAGRSIARGQELLEVADVDGPWELVIELPVRRFGHFKSALTIDEHPKVSFLLAADTSQRYQGRVVEFEEATSLNLEHQQFIKLRADIDSEHLSIDQARVGVTAKIYCGRSSLGYQWFHDIGEAFRKHVMFYLN